MTHRPTTFKNPWKKERLSLDHDLTRPKAQNVWKTLIKVLYSRDIKLWPITKLNTAPQQYWGTLPVTLQQPSLAAVIISGGDDRLQQTCLLYFTLFSFCLYFFFLSTIASAIGPPYVYGRFLAYSHKLSSTIDNLGVFKNYVNDFMWWDFETLIIVMTLFFFLRLMIFTWILVYYYIVFFRFVIWKIGLPVLDLYPDSITMLLP